MITNNDWYYGVSFYIAPYFELYSILNEILGGIWQLIMPCLIQELILRRKLVSPLSYKEEIKAKTC